LAALVDTLGTGVESLLVNDALVDLLANADVGVSSK
jgi:hypothetical protein